MQIELKDVLAVLGDKTLQISMLEGQVLQLQEQVKVLTAKCSKPHEAPGAPPAQ